MFSAQAAGALLIPMPGPDPGVGSAWTHTGAAHLHAGTRDLRARSILGASRTAVRSLSAEQTWPNTHETLLTTWKIVAFTATSVLLVLLLVILARMFQTKFKAHFPPRLVPSHSRPGAGSVQLL